MHTAKYNPTQSGTTAAIMRDGKVVATRTLSRQYSAIDTGWQCTKEFDLREIERQENCPLGSPNEAFSCLLKQQGIDYQLPGE